MKCVALTILSLFLAAPATGLPVYRESEIFDPSSGEATGIDFSVLHLDLVGTDGFFDSRHPKHEPGLEMDLSGRIEEGSGALLDLDLEFDVPITGAASDDDFSSSYFYWSPEGLAGMTARESDYVGSLRISFDERPSSVTISATLIDYAPRVTKTFGIRWRLRTPGRAAPGPVIVPVPEPSTGLLVALGLAGLTFLRFGSPA